MRPSVLALAALLLASSEALAGPMPACVAVTLSANHRVLVTNEFTVDQPDETKLQKITGSVFQVLHELNEPNAGTRLTGPETYWTRGGLWSVHFPSNTDPEIVACPYVLVTDDAEFLVFVGNQFSNIALRIYRRREHPGQRTIGPGPDTGVLVRAIPRDEIIPPPASIPARTITDHTPQWYSDGVFTFPNNRTLVFKGKAAGTITVDLTTGTVSRQSNP